MLVLMHPCTFLPPPIHFVVKSWICAKNREGCHAVKYLEQLMQIKWKIAYVYKIYSNKFINYNLGCI